MNLYFKKLKPSIENIDLNNLINLTGQTQQVQTNRSNHSDFDADVNTVVWTDSKKSKRKKDDVDSISPGEISPDIPVKHEVDATKTECGEVKIEEYPLPDISVKQENVENEFKNVILEEYPVPDIPIKYVVDEIEYKEVKIEHPLLPAILEPVKPKMGTSRKRCWDDLISQDETEKQ